MAQSVQVKKVSWWMERLADYMIANPYASLSEIATALDKTPTWISIVKNSDVFIDYWKERSHEHSETVTNEIKAKAFAASELALDAINEKLELGAAAMTTSQLLEVVDVTQKRFGYGESARQAPQLNLSLGFITQEQLADAREKLRSVQTKMIEVKPVEDKVE